MIPLIDELAVKYRDDTKLSFQAARKKLIEKFSRAPFKLHGATVSQSIGQSVSQSVSQLECNQSRI